MLGHVYMQWQYFALKLELCKRNYMLNPQGKLSYSAVKLTTAFQQHRFSIIHRYLGAPEATGIGVKLPSNDGHFLDTWKR